MKVWIFRGIAFAATALVILVLLGLNPWFAILPIIALSAFVIRGWQRWLQQHLRALAIAGGVVLCALAAFTFISIRLSSPTNQAGAVPDLELRSNYRGIFTCQARCGTWAVEESVEVTMPAVLYARRGDSITRAFARTDWRYRAATAPEKDVVHLRLERLTQQQKPAARLWPFRTTSAVDLPTWPDLRLPPAPETTELMVALGWRRPPTPESLNMVIRLTPESSVVLRYPRHAVLATTPASSTTSDIAGRQQERTIKANEVVGDEVSADLLTPFMRSDPAAKFVALGVSEWGWLIAAGVVGFVITPYIRSKGEAVIPSILGRRKSKTTPRQ